MTPTVTEQPAGRAHVRARADAADAPPGRPGRVLLRLPAITTAGSERRRLKDLSLSVHEGEILGIAGVAGNGQLELAEVIAGVSGARCPAGSRSTARPWSAWIRKRAQELRIGRIPEDRIGTGLLMQSPLADSMALPGSARRPSAAGACWIAAPSAPSPRRRSPNIAISAAGPLARTGTLSGGNLQKALLARELAWDPLVVIAAQPTRGLDVGATQFVQGKFLELRAAGRGLIVICEDLEELFQIADRIAVMSGGRIVGDFPIAEASITTIGRLMAGGEQAVPQDGAAA